MLSTQPSVHWANAPALAASAVAAAGWKTGSSASQRSVSAGKKYWEKVQLASGLQACSRMMSWRKNMRRILERCDDARSLHVVLDVYKTSRWKWKTRKEEGVTDHVDQDGAAVRE